MARLDNAASQLVAREGIKGAIIGGAISLFFALLMFGRRENIPLHGMEGVIFDAFPQSIMIMLLGSVAPAFIVRNQIRKGRLGEGGSDLPNARGIMMSVVPLALLVAGIGIAAHVLVLPHLSPVVWETVTVLVFKSIYGACLSGAAAMTGVHAVVRR